MSHSPFASIEEALTALRAGKMVVLVDSQDRENEGDLVIAAEKVTPEVINFMTQYARGLVCLPLAEEILERLQLPMMVKHNTSKFGTAFTVSIGAAHGITTGISAQDRAHTVRAAIDPNSKPEDISMPGHIFPLRAQPGGVLVRNGHTEGSVDLARLAGLQPAAVICEVMNPDGTMARLHDLLPFAKQHNLPVISIEDLITHRIKTENLLEEVASTRLPLRQYGDFTMKVFISKVDQTQHIALIKGAIHPAAATLVRIHSECLTGDTFHSARCDCGSQLETALARVSKQGGVLLYMKQEGRGIGLANKIKAYALQDQGLDTVEANHQLGFAADERDYGIASQILRRLGVHQLRLLTNNPQKVEGMQRYGVEVVAREPLEVQPTEDNISYLRTKREKLGHLLSLELGS